MRHVVPEQLRIYLPEEDKAISLMSRVNACELALVDVLAQLSDIRAHMGIRKRSKAGGEPEGISSPEVNNG